MSTASVAVPPTEREIRIAATVIWDVRENIYDWDDAITRAAANLGVKRASVAYCLKRVRDYLTDDATLATVEHLAGRS